MKTVYLAYALAGIVLCGPAQAQQQSIAVQLGLIAFPSKGQSEQQQTEDEQACYGWATQQTGVNPGAAQPAPRPTEASANTQAAAAAGGAARGAAGAALLGAAFDEDAGKWAAAGAVFGASRGRRSAKMRNAQAQASAAAGQESAAAKDTELFKKAFSVCMQSKSYTIS